MANLSWIKGMKSPNVDGARKHKAKMVDSIIERLLTGVFSYPQVKKRIVKLTDAQYIDAWLKLMVLKVPKPSANTLSEEELQALNEKMEQKVINDARQKTG